jgi:putative FmdB family regulatory protein
VPTYQYTCTECGEPVEALQKFTDAPLTVCTACGGRLRKVFSPVGIVFKGSGFYRTDSRKGASATDSATKETKETKEKVSASSSSSSGESSSGNGNGSGSGDKPAAKKTETASSTSKSSSSEKVA